MSWFIVALCFSVISAVANLASVGNAIEAKDSINFRLHVWAFGASVLATVMFIVLLAGG